MHLKSLTALSLALVAGTLTLTSQSAAQNAAPVATQQDPNQTVAIVPVPQWVKPSDLLDVPQDAQGSLFVRRQDTLVRLNGSGSDSYIGQMIRILQPGALQLGNIAIAWNPAAGQARVHRVRIHRQGQIIDVLENNEFEILRREDQLEQDMLTGTLTATLRVPDLRVGDDLEIEYTVPSNDPTMRETSHGVLFMSAAPPSGQFRINLSWEEGQEPGLQLSDDLSEVAQQSANEIDLRWTNPDAITAPRNAPPRYDWMRTLEYSDFANWAAVSQRFFALFEDASTITDRSSLRAEAARIKGAYPTKTEQMQAALQLVQQQVRYVYVGLNGGNFTPAQADETWQRRYGDCKGKTAMLLALLKELEIDAEAVLVSNYVSTDGLDEKLANPGLFDHVLVRANIAGNPYWLDGTLPEVIDGRDKPYFPYQWVLPLTAEGSDIELIPEEPFELPLEMGIIDIDARAGFDQPAVRTTTYIRRGAGAIEDHTSFSSVSASQLEIAFRQQLEGSAEWDMVESVAYRFDRETQASVLTIKGTGPVDWDDYGDEGYSLILPGGGFIAPERRQRPSNQPADAPYWQVPTYSCYATTVRLPDDTDIEKWSYNSVFDTMLYGHLYYRVMERRDDRTIRMIRGSRTQQTEISSIRAQRDNGRLASFDNSKAVIGYYPELPEDDMDRQQSVPAADEVDWTSDDVPCLPRDVLRR